MIQCIKKGDPVSEKTLRPERNFISCNKKNSISKDFSLNEILTSNKNPIIDINSQIGYIKLQYLILFYNVFHMLRCNFDNNS